MNEIYKINDQISLKIVDTQTITFEYTFEGNEKGKSGSFTVDISYNDLEKLLYEIQNYEYVSWKTNNKRLSIRGQAYMLELLFTIDEAPFECRRNLNIEESITLKNIIKNLISV